MAYFEYACKDKDHRHSISTDRKIKSEKKLKCKFCGGVMKQVEFRFKEKEEK